MITLFSGRERSGVSRHRQSVKWDCRKLTANINLLPTRGGGIIRIFQDLMRGSGKFYRDTNDILQTPPPTPSPSPLVITNDHIVFFPDRLRSLLPPATPEVSLELSTPV